MSESDLKTSSCFIDTLRTFCKAPVDERGEIANQLSDAIIYKNIDLAVVRQELIDSGESDLLSALDELLSLIEPYITESSGEE